MQKTAKKSRSARLASPAKRPKPEAVAAPSVPVLYPARGRAALGNALGVSANTIGQWASEGMPVAERSAGRKGDLYDVAACARWRIATLTSPSVREEREKLRLQREVKEFEDELGKLIPIEAVQAKLVDLAEAVTSSLRQMVERVAPAIAGKTAEEIEFTLNTEIHGWRSKFNYP